MHKCFLSFFLLLFANFSVGQDPVVFLNPPDRAKPRTWMHAMSGNMTKEGLTKDLESMADVGIGGLLLFNVTQGIPNGPIKYNSEEHHEMLTHAAVEAERLGLSYGVHNCDGWSSSGGPWVLPEESMKMLVWSETVLQGGEVNVQLSQPTTREGFYEDITVLAYPSLSSELDDAENKALITASDPDFDVALISDGRIDESSSIKTNTNDSPWIQYEYKRPKTIRSVMLVFHDRNGEAILQSSEDGTNWKDERKLFKVRTGKGEWAINDHFNGITSKFFRLQLNQDMKIKDGRLTSTYFINNPLGRLAIARTEDADLDNIGNPSVDMIIDRKSIIDLTDKMNSSGKLEAKLGKGNWTIMRFGYTSTGAFNNPASDEGRGLEVDKLNRPAFKKHYDSFIKKVVINSKAKAPNAFQYVEIDSYEMGGQNWTNGFKEAFQKRFNYNFLDFLPLVAGRFVESTDVSDGVLYDFRRLISDLMTRNYFDYFTELCHEDGLQSYVEPYGFGPLNDLDIARHTDLPMGEFWMNRPITMAKSAVSGAHIYGKNIISAESFTSNPSINWKGNPAMAKNSGDLAWTQGINEFMFHRFAHQANVHAEPGMTMNKWGFHFDRTQTWWKNAGTDWFKYIARGSYLLREGYPVSDFAVFIGDGSPNSSYRRDQLEPEVPKWLNFDCVNADVLKNRLQISEKNLVLPEGISYKALLLKNSETLEIETIQRLYDLAKAGVPLLGETPVKLAGYGHGPKMVSKYEAMMKELATTIKPIDSWDTFFSSQKITPDFKVNDRPDIDFIHRRNGDADIYFFFNPDSISSTFYVNFRIEDKIPELWNPMTGLVTKSANFKQNGQVLTVSIHLEAGESTFVVFRESAKNVVGVAKDEEVDFFLNGDNEVVAEFHSNGVSKVRLSNNQLLSNEIAEIPTDIIIGGEWRVTFNDKHYNFTKLTDWTEHSDPNVRYFSGTATYRKTFFSPVNNIDKNTKAVLDLGDTKIVAEVQLNGRNVGIAWTAPFKIDITNYLKEGENELVIKITNQWSNKLIGDERFPANDGGYKVGPHRATDLIMPDWYINNDPRPAGLRTTFTTAPFYTKDDPLMSSGLLGPVEVKFSKHVNLQDKILPQIDMPNGRIAFSSDGNLHDSDDWGATAMSLALLHYAGLSDRFVHYDYNNHMGKSRESWERIMDDAAKGGAQRFGLDVSRVFDDQTEKRAAISNFVGEANNSAQQDPLWFICAGPMQMAYEMIAGSNPDSHPFIHLISHGEWNQKHAHESDNKTWKDLKQDFPKLKFHEIIDQNKSNDDKDFHSHMSNWYWLKTSDDPNWQWLYDIDDTWQVDSLESWKSDTKEQYDVSDAGMTYWLISGGPRKGNARAGWPEARALFEGKKMIERQDAKALLEPQDYLIIEAESTTSPLGKWVQISKGEANYIDGASGGKQIEFQGNEASTGPPTSPLTYEFTAPKDGNFRLLLMASKRLQGDRGDRCNDAYVKLAGDFSSASTLTTTEMQDFNKYFQEGSVKTPELSWHWGIRAEKGRHEFHNIIYKLKKGEQYKLTLAGRSQRFSVDYLLLYDSEKFEVQEAQQMFRMD